MKEVTQGTNPVTQIGQQDADGGTIDSKRGAYTKSKKPNVVCKVTPGNTIPKVILEINHRIRCRWWNKTAIAEHSQREGIKCEMRISGVTLGNTIPTVTSESNPQKPTRCQWWDY